MTDLWSGISTELSASEGEWLYRIGSELRGPLPEEVVSSKIATGEIPLTASVGREGGGFHPVIRVATFAKAVVAAQKRVAKQRSRRFMSLLALTILVLVLGGGGVGYVVWKSAEAKRIAQEQEREAMAARIAAEQDKIEKTTKGPELLALVSLGSEEEVEIREKRRPLRKKTRNSGAPKNNPPEESFGSCQRSQSAILSVLQKHVAKINVCVEDEKSRDAARLPPTLKLDFVVQASGSVTDFSVLDRHYRTGPMNNCMIKVFRRVRYPTVAGSNCPVTIPIKIRG